MFAKWFDYVLIGGLERRHVTFICGQAGVCALGAVVAKYAGDKELLQYYLSSFKEVISSCLNFVKHQRLTRK